MRRIKSLALCGMIAAGAMAAAAASQAATTTLSGSLTADNGFFAFLSTSPDTLGTQIGSGTSWTTAHALTPTVLQPGGVYYLNIEVVNQDGIGGLLGDFTLTGPGQFANGSSSLSTNTTDWTVSNNNGNSSFAVQTWVAATGAARDEGANGAGPWGTIAGISKSAHWIADPRACAYCTYDFTTAITVPGVAGGVPEPATWAMLILGLGMIGFAARRRREGLASAA